MSSPSLHATSRTGLVWPGPTPFLNDTFETSSSAENDFWRRVQVITLVVLMLVSETDHILVAPLRSQLRKKT